MITVKPYGGLANRMRVLYSVLACNAQIKDRVKIIWDCSPSLNCPFDELFTDSDAYTVRNIRQGFFRKAERFVLKRLQFNRLRPFVFDHVLYDRHIRKMRKENYDFIKLFDQSSVFIETCYSFYAIEGPVDFLKPKASIEQRAGKIYQHFGENTFGIHIRQTDHHIARKFSPASEFKKMIRQKIESQDDATFFLATDSKKIELEIIEEFSDRIITSGDKELSRNSPEGIKGALVDIICLSRTQKIYGSLGSSFSHIPTMLTGVDHEVISNRQQE